MVLCIFINFYLGALAYNLIESGSTDRPLTSNTHMEFYKWGKVFQIFSVFLDIISIVMITDAVLQDRNYYPEWAARFKSAWNDSCGGWVRVLAVWAATALLTAATSYGIRQTG